MTETEMSCELTMAFSDCRQNSVLASIVSGCLAELEAPEWTEADYALAKKFLSSYDAHTREEMRRDLEQPVAVEAAKRECRARSAERRALQLSPAGFRKAPDWEILKFPPLKTGPLSCKIKNRRRVP